MNSFSNILCYAEPVERAGRALSRALELARFHGAKVSLVSVIDEIPVRAPNLQDQFAEIRQEELEDLLEDIGFDDVDVDIQVIAGSLGAIHVIQTVIEQGYDLVIKPVDDAGRGRTLLFGSHDQRLLRKCPVPVWIVRPREHMQRILAAIDVDPHQPENAELNRSILALADGLATHFDSELHVVHAWQMVGEEVLRSGRVRWSEQDLDRMLENTRQQHQHWLDDTLQNIPLNTDAARVHLVKGRADAVIGELVRQEAINLTVMGTLARTGIPGFFIGNTAERILSALHSSVLAIKPSGFRSPIRDYDTS